MNIDCLRLSVTDRCNLRCVYCHPLSDYHPAEHEEILGLEEILRIVRLFVECGVRKVRLTGGEPLLRRDIVLLVRELAAIAGIEDLSVTTNGIFLESLASGLKAAGLQRVNISVDSIDRKTYERITGHDLLPEVLKGIYKAIEVGLTPVKINSVIIKGLNDSAEQITALAGMSVNLPLSVRFIEYFPTNKSTRPATDYVPNAEVRAFIERKYGPLVGTTPRGCPGQSEASIVSRDVSRASRPRIAGKMPATHKTPLMPECLRLAPTRGNGPAEYFKMPGSAGTVGFISGRSSNFCRSCSRLRLTSDGKLMPCLYSARAHDLKILIRNGQNDRQIRSFLSKIIAEKVNYTKSNSPKEEFSMCKIGG
jgi:cyclic pyranopterin phosphate synthase